MANLSLHHSLPNEILVSVAPERTWTHMKPEVIWNFLILHRGTKQHRTKPDKTVPSLQPTVFQSPGSDILEQINSARFLAIVEKAGWLEKESPLIVFKKLRSPFYKRAG
ncbi:hypothetical protein RRG08_040818 [Elysia crispata]|uniref:Uncharacterized protein n=1 Tax=Elysia crispata TaxID=231223 RepID=A0AAE0ZAX2_9GAST|nr:hypothetical protein RRG08_040818 [Elysia crispata]